MGKTRIIAETGAGQHGVATATVCALFKLKCTIYMGETDVHRQQMNADRMKLLGAEVKSVKKGQWNLKDAMNEALRDWISNRYDLLSIRNGCRFSSLSDHSERVPKNYWHRS